MDEIEVQSFTSNYNQKSTLFDQFERLSVEIQINQAMLRRSLSEPGATASLLYQPHLGAAPPLVQRPVEQGKRGRGGSWGLHKMFKKILRPMFLRKKTKRGDDYCYQEAQQDCNKKDLAKWKRFSKSVRL